MLITCAMMLFMNVPIAQAQAQESAGARGGTSDAYKKVDADHVIRNRRPGKGVQKRAYRTNSAFPDGTPHRGQMFATVGVTISRGRLATDAENSDSRIAKVKGCVQWDGEKCVSRKAMVLVRNGDDDPVADKEQIQMSIEYLAYLDGAGTNQSNSIGYLYVINREQYADGTFGKPKLIFPTLNTYEGDNRVLPGKTVAMPAPDRPWTISRSSSAKIQSFETYTIIASPEPLKDLAGFQLKLESNSIILNEELVAKWVKLWGSELRADLENSSGQLVTQREVQSSKASNNRKRDTHDDEDDLLQDDPPPQIIFRKVVKPRGTILFTVKLPFKEKTPPSVSQP